MDTVTKEKRSWVMSRIHSKDTKPEMLVRSFLHRHGFRFRLHVKKLPGKPDIVLSKYKTVIEVRGCFWHHHEGCKIATMPSSNVDFWNDKLERNMVRDKRTGDELKKLGWNLIVIWECELKKPGFLEPLPERIRGGIAPGTETHLESMQAANSVPPVDPNRELQGMISMLTPEEMEKALEMMAKFSVVINSAEYKKLNATPGISTDEVDDYLFEKILGKEKMLENAARRRQFRECAGDEK